MNTQEAIEKIKKILAIKQNTTNENECENALLMAMRLSAKLGLNVAEIEASMDKKEDEEIIENEYECTNNMKLQKHEIELMDVICKALGCSVLLYTRFNKTIWKQEQLFMIIGTKTDSELAKNLYPFIMNQLKMYLKQDRKEYMRKQESEEMKEYYKLHFWEHPLSSVEYNKSWYFGAVKKIKQKLDEKFKTDFTQSEQNQYALVIQNKMKRCENYLATMENIRKGRASRGISLNSSAYSAGFNSADNVSLNGGITTKSRMITA